jgi:hypothetical protein
MNVELWLEIMCSEKPGKHYTTTHAKECTIYASQVRTIAQQRVQEACASLSPGPQLTCMVRYVELCRMRRKSF